ncbi:MAG TPA: carbamoyltransferase C-terminal domain-containing protein [Actinomycetota bacterium]|nr:carbamoyltransferase C-terminal domain-containing protein [Actinomycetota bacterium]
MHVLGINCLAHDTAAALVVDGQVVAFVEEERLSREKHTWKFPDRAIRWCLDTAGLSIGQIDLVTFDYRPGLDYARGMAFDILPNLPRSAKHWAKQTYVDGRHVWRARDFRTRWGYKGRIRFLEHHRTHAATAFLSSPFDRAVALSIDRGGDYLSTAAYLCEGTQMREIARVRNPHSLGELYSAVTWWLGFKPNYDEGKVMGLASYGRPTYLDDFRSMVRCRPDGRFRIDLSWAGWHTEHGNAWVSQRFLKRFGPPRRPDEPITGLHEDVAYGVQAVIEEAALNLAQEAAIQCGTDLGLCLAGGVALNSVMNARLLTGGPFKDLYIPAPCGDAGNAIGGALLAWHEETGKPRGWQMEHAYLGPEFSASAIRRALEERKLTYREVPDPSREAARLLAAGNITGWFQGRAEAGPRALGNRSILADPRPDHMKDTINAEVKHREPFRPFAPSVLAEEAPNWFEPVAPSPFMLLCLPIRPERRSQVPAITHVDGTGRLQTVTEAANPPFRRLIEAFHQETGVPMVLNTSFNDQGEPIVCSPGEALRTFFSTGLDALVIGRYVLEKEPPA